MNEEGTSESGFLQNTTQHNLTTSRPEDRKTIQPQTNLNQSPSLPYRTYIEETHIYNVLCLYDILPVRGEVDHLQNLMIKSDDKTTFNKICVF